ncbi:hypothetical protein K504DRAFT_504245 [Pleomassaria siparia CBS 279.74]|uniref:Uncharacterized protein n=1 Tax=Pleomassaria siparia CBS 279.74 TaxID=1314801 RepID=A0A6G1K2G1_9PLEO|nr:hypothetical protein K504DRAFT_504245 [Pleomassaria siparia CBS 279.74]
MAFNLSVVGRESSQQEHLHGPQRIDTGHVLNRLGGLTIDVQSNEQKLPSIHALLNHIPPAGLNTITQSSSSLTNQAWNGVPFPSAVPPPVDHHDEQSGRRQLQQVSSQQQQQANHASFAYPTPHNSPVDTLANLNHLSASRRSPRRYRYADNTISNHANEASEAERRRKFATGIRMMSMRNKKAAREACSRFKLSDSMANVQNVCLEVNPNMGSLAAPRRNVPNGGWRPLKSNNINKLIENPLKINKEDALWAVTTIVQQSNGLFEDVDHVLRKLGHREIADRLAYSVRNRACAGFRYLGQRDPRPRI